MTVVHENDRKTRPTVETAGSLLLDSKLKRLLLATDLSARSDRALDRAIQLARVHKAHLSILHVLDEELPDAVLTQLVHTAETEITEYLKKLVPKNDVDFSVRVRAGRDYREILDAATSDDCNLIILGRHRNESTDRSLRGTTMERVIRHGIHPVLVVAERMDAPYRRVMLGIDFSVVSRLAVRAAVVLSPDANFHFVHAFHPPFEGFLKGQEIRNELAVEHSDRLTKLIAEEMDMLTRSRKPQPAAGSRIHNIVRNGGVIDVLRNEAMRIKPDLIVIGTHSRTGLARAILGSVAEDLLNSPPCDVLAVKAS